MAQQFVIPSVFEAIDRMSPAMAVMTRNVNAFGNSAEIAVARGERAFRRMMAPVNNLYNRFNSMMGGLGAPVGIAAVGFAAKEATDIFIDFGEANSKVAAGLNMTLEQIKPLTEDAKKLGATTKFTASQVSDLQFEYAKLGFSTEQILKMTESTLGLAAATQFELGPTATTVGAAIRAYGLEADQAARVNDVLAASASKTALDMNDFFENLSTFAPVARAFNFSMEDSIALFGKIRDSGFDASSAATALRNIFLNLADSNGKLARALGKPAQNLPELLGGMVKLRNAGVDLATMLEITDKRSVAAFATLLNGAESVQVLANELNNANGFAEKMANTQLDNVRGSLTILKSSWEGFVLSVDDGTNAISRGIRKWASVFTDVLQIMSGTAPANAQLNETEKQTRATAESVLFWGEAALYTTGAIVGFKVALIASRVALTAMNIAVGIGNALFTTSTVLTYENVVAQKAFLMTSRAASIALEIMNGNFAILNTTMLANPAVLFAAGIMAVVAASYLLDKYQKDQIENFEYLLDLQISNEYARQKKMVDELTKTYIDLGYSIENATKKAAEQKYMMSNSNLQEAQLKVKQAENSVIAAYDNSWFGFGEEISRTEDNLMNARRELTLAQAGRSAQTNNIQSLVQSGVLSTKEAMNIFGGKKLDGINLEQSQKPISALVPPDQNQDWIKEMNKSIGGGFNLNVEVKNSSDLPVALGTGSRNLDVQPNTKRTTIMDKQ